MKTFKLSPGSHFTFNDIHLDIFKNVVAPLGSIFKYAYLMFQ